jgi:hypothetical protein
MTPQPSNTDGLSFNLNFNDPRIRPGRYISVRPVLFNKLEADPEPNGHVAVRRYRWPAIVVTITFPPCASCWRWRAG